MNWIDTRTRLNQRLEDLRREREGFLGVWRELSDYVQPYRGRFLGRNDRPNSGLFNDEHIIDNKATRAIRVLAAGMQSGLTSPGQPWFKLTTQDPGLIEFGPVHTWLSDVEAIFRDIFGRSNIYNALHGVYTELGLFGTAGMIVSADHENVIRARPLTAGEAMFDQGPRLHVDTLFRESKMTVRQLVEQFGIKNVGSVVRDAYDKGDYGRWFDVVHAIEPNDDVKPNRKDAAGKKWQEIYYEVGGSSDKPLAISGYEEFPAMVPRWDIVGVDVYGRSPAMETLADIKMLQTLQTRSLQVIDKNTNPPLTAPATMKGQVINALPGGVNFINAAHGNQSIQPVYQPTIGIRDLESKIERVQESISEGFYADVFMMLTKGGKGQMTATEVAERHEEKLVMIGPVLERLQHELLDPLIDRTFAIAQRAGMLPPIPEELKGTSLKVDYISPLAQAQKMVGIGSIKLFTDQVTRIAKLDQSVMDRIDLDQVVPIIADAMGVPSRLIRSESDVEKRRKEMKKAQEAPPPGGAMPQVAGGAPPVDPSAMLGALGGMGGAMPQGLNIDPAALSQIAGQMGTAVSSSPALSNIVSSLLGGGAQQ